MKAVVIYESMYGNTHLIADAIAEGLRTHGDATVVPVGELDAQLLERADFVVVGGPTHADGMSHASTRQAAITAAEKPGSEVVLDGDPDGFGTGLREWFASLGDFTKAAAAFDTRMDVPPAFSGRASKGIARKLKHHGATLIGKPKSFLVTKENQLEPHEEEHAREWGAHLGAVLGKPVLR